MKKEYRFAFVLDEQEKSALDMLAELEGGLSHGALIRRLIRLEAEKRGVLLYKSRVLKDDYVKDVK